MASISNLPEELLLNVFSNLDFESRKSARAVCKQWNRVSYDKRLIMDDWTVLKSAEDLNNISPFSRHINVEIHNSDVLHESMPFWKAHGEHIKSIKIKFNKRINNAFWEILQKCPIVEDIVLELEEDAPEYVESESELEGDIPSVSLPNLKLLELNFANALGLRYMQTLLADTSKLENVHYSCWAEPNEDLADGMSELQLVKEKLYICLEGLVQLFPNTKLRLIEYIVQRANLIYGAHEVSMKQSEISHPFLIDI